MYQASIEYSTLTTLSKLRSYDSAHEDKPRRSSTNMTWCTRSCQEAMLQWHPMCGVHAETAGSQAAAPTHSSRRSARASLSSLSCTWLYCSRSSRARPARPLYSSSSTCRPRHRHSIGKSLKKDSVKPQWLSLKHDENAQKMHLRDPFHGHPKPSI